MGVTVLGIQHSFYPRSPCGERPHKHGQLQQGHVVSIHALLAESDWAACAPSNIGSGFYPRSPCGERPV